ncbi:hypothetical protein [Algisphaera agarilytica]|uniref:Type II secretory pathway component PulK n=1 Tax=Algisphaera agarilytica TaxID=1385975 RepID=A0A7X0H571_9BACT|nr:hypothetical protein [Algisphaera agarilytica]MBB6429507.1 type II secretory pathway component PulK [Algisphaera agarilytica]
MRQTRDQGFVLLLVLAVLAVLGTALASLALRVHTQQQAAALDLHRLQRDLAVRSADEAILAQRDRLAAGPAGVVAGRALLGDQLVQLRWANEDAKANLNSLQKVLSEEVFARELDRFAEAGGAEGLSLDADGAYKDFGLTASGAQARWPAFASFDQLSEREEVQRVMRESPPTLGPFDRLTLWGSGKINPRHADPLALGLAFRAHLPPREADEVALVLSGQAVSSRESLQEALAELLEGWDNPQMIEGLETLLTSAAQTTSLRIVIDDGRRTDVVLRVQNPQGNRRGGDYELRW